MRTLRRNALFKALVLCQCAVLPTIAFAQDATGGTSPQSSPVELDGIVVTGRRAADRLAIDDKRLADNQVDSIRADDVGRLPDQNVAEAVRRLPGVSVSNDQGEGRYLTVRGVAPELLNVTLNGQTAAAPEPDGRQVKLDDIPSALIGSVTLVKTLTPDLDANAIAGQVNIETLSAFDRGRNFATARAAYGYYDMNGENPYEFDATVGGLFGADKQFGAVLAINHSSRKIGSQQFAGSEDWMDINGQELPEEFAIRHYQPHRTRQGAVANFDWKPSDRSKMFLRLMHSVYKDDETRQHFGVTLPDDEDDYASQTGSTGSFTDGGRAERRVRMRREDTSTSSALVGGEFKFGEFNDRILNVETTFSKARKRDPRRDEWTFRTSSNIGGSYDLGRDPFRVEPAAAAYDAANFRGYQVRYGSRRANEDLFQARADYQFPIDGDSGSWFKLGAKIIDRDKDNDEDRATWRQSGAGTLTLDQALAGSYGPVFTGDVFGPGADHALADAYFNANPGHFSYRADSTLSDSLASDYRISERITAAYAMASLRFGDATVLPGVRIEHTSSTYAAKSVTEDSTLDQGFDSFGSQSYTDLFPGLNFRYEIGDNISLRAAATRAIGRPNYEDIAPYVMIEDAGNGRYAVTKGNPDVDPLRSTNLDVALEYYVGNRGIVSAAAFYKKISNPIFWTRETVIDGTFAGRVLPEAVVSTPTNAVDASVSGIEFNAQFELSFLPAPWDGFSAGASMTFVDSEANGVPGRPEGVPLATQSDRVASANLSYEKGGFSARVAYSYRSASLAEVGDSADSDLYTDRFGQWDARMSYAIGKFATVFLEGSNLNDAAFRQYYGRRSHLSEEERYGWSVRTGIQLSF